MSFREEPRPTVQKNVIAMLTRVSFGVTVGFLKTLRVVCRVVCDSFAAVVETLVSRYLKHKKFFRKSE